MSDKQGVNALNALLEKSQQSNDACVSLIKAIAECIDVESDKSKRALGYGQGRQSYGWSHWLQDNMPLTYAVYKERRKEIGHSASANEMRRRYRIAYASVIAPTCGEIFATQVIIGRIIFDAVQRSRYPEGVKSLDVWIKDKLHIPSTSVKRGNSALKTTIEEELSFGLLAADLIDILNTHDLDDNGNAKKFNETEQATAELLIDIMKERMVVNRWKKKTAKKSDNVQQNVVVV